MELLCPQIEKTQFVEFAKQLSSSLLLKLDLCLCFTNAKEHKDIINNNTIRVCVCVRACGGGGGGGGGNIMTSTSGSALCRVLVGSHEYTSAPLTAPV